MFKGLAYALIHMQICSSFSNATCSTFASLLRQKREKTKNIWGSKSKLLINGTKCSWWGEYVCRWVLSFSSTLPGGKTKCSLASLYIYYQVLSRRPFVKEINEALSEREQIRQDTRVGLGLSLSFSDSSCISWGTLSHHSHSPQLGRRGQG